MNDNVKPLFPGKPTGTEPVPELIKQLEDLLSRAKTGELQSLAFACCCSDDAIMHGTVVYSDVFSLIGAIHFVEAGLIRMVGASRG